MAFNLLYMVYESPLDQTFSLLAFRITCICSESGTAQAHVTDKMNTI